jgi:hypothetical protein
MATQIGSDKLVVLGRFPSDCEAALVHNVLNDYGIRTQIAGAQQDLVQYPVPLGATLVVAERNREEALKIIYEVRKRARPHVEWPEEEKSWDEAREPGRIFKFFVIATLGMLVFAAIQQLLR